MAAFDFFFVPPYLTFAVSDTEYLVTFAVMLVVALVISTLTSRVRAQAEAARQRERRTATLYAMSRDLVRQQGLDELLRAAAPAHRGGLREPGGGAPPRPGRPARPPGG